MDLVLRTVFVFLLIMLITRTIGRRELGSLAPFDLILLVVMGDVVGMYGGYFVAVQLLGANPITYYDSSFQFLDMEDFTVGLVKAAVFGLILSVVACVRGYHTEGGAEGVGRATTQAVVVGSLAILLADFFLTRLLF